MISHYISIRWILCSSFWARESCLPHTWMKKLLKPQQQSHCLFRRVAGRECIPTLIRHHILRLPTQA